MQRGMIVVSKEEAVWALKAANEAENLAPTLIQKLELAAQNGTEQNLEISEDEAEIILDNLPEPSKSDATVNSLRFKLSNFLAEFRFK